MRRRRLPIGLVVPVALAALVGVLAVLQYRWLGQVSAAERDRMRTTLMQRADAFARDFDREVLNLYVALQTESAGLATRDWAAFSKRYDIWRQSAEYPQLVKSIYFVENEGTLELLQFRPDAKAFETIDWPEELAPIQRRIQQSDGRVDTSMGAAARTIFLLREPIVPSIPAIVMAVPVVQPIPNDPKVTFRFSSRYLIAVLDRAYLESTLLPALAERHFPEGDAPNFRFAVLEAAAPATSIYSRGVPDGTTLDPVDADAVVPFFSLRLELTNQVTARAMMMHGTTAGFDLVAAPPPPPPPAPIPAAGWIERSTVTTATPRQPVTVSPVSPPPMAATETTITARGTATLRLPNTTAPLGPRPSVPPAAATPMRSSPPPPPPMAGSRSGRNGSVSVFVEQRGTRAMNDIRISQAIGSPAWQFVVQHTAGSLDAAVAQLRRRNLYLSFGILAVLASGVGLIVVNARRSERLAAQQMEFVATVSHELRTPLAVIRSAAQNLSAGVVHEPAQARRYGDLIEQEGRRLTDMVEQVLAYAGVSDARGLVSARPADAGAIVGDAVAASAPLVEAAGFEQAIDIAQDLPPVMVDEGAIRRAVHNLLTNALKHGADGRWLGITVRRGAAARSQDGHEVQISVSDRGRGIDAQDLPHIFEPFYRGRYALDRQVQGNGLGLSLVKRIAEAHGGRVSVRSAPETGEGTTFTLHIPALNEALAADPAGAAGAELPERA